VCRTDSLVYRLVQIQYQVRYHRPRGQFTDIQGLVPGRLAHSYQLQGCFGILFEFGPLGRKVGQQ